MDIHLIWIVGVAGIVLAFIAYGRWHAKINLGIVIALKGIWKFITDPKTCRVVEQCCIEVAVLWFVFPLLDTLYDRRRLSDRALHGSYLVAAMFFVFAIVISHIAREGKTEE